MLIHVRMLIFSCRKMTAIIGITTGFREFISDESAAYELACNCGKIAKESYTEKYFFMSLTKFCESLSFYDEEKNYYGKQIPAHKNEKR